MKKTFIIALVLGIYSLNFAQNQNKEEELTNLKKQVTTLKNKNTRLEKNTADLKSSLNKMEIGINDLDLKLKVITDSLHSKARTINHLKRKTDLLLVSLTHRKKLFIAGFIIGGIIVIAIAVFAIMKYNKDRKKLETKLSEQKKLEEEELNTLKTNLQNQINLAKEGFELKIKEQEMRISELKK